MPDIITSAISRRAQHRRPATLNDLLYRYQSTPEVRETGEENRRQVRRAVKKILDKFNRLPITEVEDPAFRSEVYDWRDEMAEKPAECERMIGILNRVLSFGLDRRLIRCNQAEAIRFRWRQRAGCGSRADIVWSPLEIIDLRRQAGEVRDVCEIALWTALRQGDILRLRKDQIAAGWIEVTPVKTGRFGTVVHLPYTLIPPLQRVVDRLLAAENDSPYLLGREWAGRTFRARFSEVKEAAGLADQNIHFHDFRGTLLTWLTEAEASIEQRAAISGHALATGSQENYIARTKALAEAAYTKLRTYLDEKHDDWYCSSV